VEVRGSLSLHMMQRLVSRSRAPAGQLVEALGEAQEMGDGRRRKERSVANVAS
jgi:hypothetical protein